MENLQNVVELADGIHWLGIRSESRLEVNVYLREFKAKQKITNMIIDPGPPVFFDRIDERIRDVIGDPRKVHIAYINHQDPDVGVNAIYLQKRNPKMSVICTEDTWRLTHFFGLKLSNFQPVDKFKKGRARLSTGHVVRFIPTPFCHFRGSCMIYDETSRILFSGDLFGGLSFEPRLFATAEDWEGIRVFHQIYMPFHGAIRLAIEKIRRLKPAPRMIAPQHGAIIQEDLIEDFLSKMYELPVGLDLLQPTIIDKEIYLQAINEILESIAQKAGQDVVDDTLQHFDAADGSFPTLFKIEDGKIVDVREANVLGSFKTLIELMMKDQPVPIRDLIKDTVIRSNWNLPIFETEAEEDMVLPEFLIDEGEETE
ncbi:MBL fold hydrolase [candidate division KSB3 bacterium]|uniref:MBL fold hydrolase n=1 Tax=candidate division KSB3 bacterium TaxID=2044937 RepID=A0A9D5JV94_9BACT|nr:MBL fold hydrolase [candidate division KSB3 bacterium]MBD3324562.1 MBL fold hydrolase [candidate division KSB3 bacterium]